ncbi:hypothetical protein RJ639_018634 [Escallonia herrerae]|uniref:Pentatricopeptide repeat-containing protein n=1 Tax=Escallonia herrerae TaxID=1293975 RepID=A0AA89AGG4_9ASTE|nr:hypothetical protein RJ639_018634 [Escallonia herrerae]
MKASVSAIKVCSVGLKLIIWGKKEPSRLFTSVALGALDSSPLFFDEQGDSISVNSHQQDNFPGLGGISADYTGVHHEPLHAFGEKENIFEAVNYDEISRYTFYQKTDNNELKRIKFILKSRGWNIDSRNNSFNMIVLDECNIMRILNDLFEESRDAALVLYFYRWSERCTGFEHTVRSICTMIHILVAGDMNHRAMDLIIYLVKKNDGEDWWCNLLLKVLYDTNSERRVLGVAYSMLVDCYTKENMTNVALKLTCQMNHLSIFPSMGVCNSLLRALLDSEQVELAWDLLEEMQSQGLALNASIISLFIHNYCSKGDLGSGWKLLMEMKTYGIKPDVVAYTILINSLSKMSLLREATSILFKLDQMGISLDSVSVTSVIDGFCKVGHWVKAIAVLNIFGLSPNIYIYNSFISKLCTDGYMGKASSVFHEMSYLGLLPDCFCYTTIIGGYCKSRSMNAALNFFGKMFKMGIKPSVATYTALVDGYCRHEDLDMAEHAFQSMILAGLVPDSIAYNTLIDGYGKKGYLHKAFGLLGTMKSAGIPPDVVTYNCVIHSLILRGYVSEAKGILDELIRRGFSPDAVTFTTLLSGYSKKGNFEEAFLVWFYMSEHHMQPDVVTCSALLNGYCKARRMKEAGALFRQMLDIGLVPDLLLYNTLIHGFCCVGNTGDACHLVNMMVEHGISPNNATHRALVLGHVKECIQNPVETAVSRVQKILLKHGISIDIDQYRTSVQRPGR